LTGAGNDKLAMTALRAGASDFLEKGALNVSLLERAIRYALERTRTHNELKRLALYDSLTGLAGRALIHDRMASEIARERRAPAGLALLFIDLDRFKQVNDSLGHRAGDMLLIESGVRISSAVRDGDTVGRLGGDEFVVALPNVGNINQASVIATRVIDAIEAPFELYEQPVRISASVGVSMFPDHGNDAESLLKSADLAMYSAKGAGKHRVHLFRPELADVATRRLHLESMVRDAWRRSEFSLVYQPTYDLTSGALRSVEALMRWFDVDGSVRLGPADFVPVLEDLGIVAVSTWAIEKACAQMAAWRSLGHVVPCVAVNASPSHLGQHDFVERVLDSLRRHGLPPEALEVEVTETAFLQPRYKSALVALATAGVRIALDDFGTGYSGLSTLRDSPFSTMKIDKSFVAALDKGPREEALVKTMVLMGTTMGLHVVAEGIETREQFRALRDMGANDGQGFLLGRPVPPATFSMS
jgi:diguanylate cyclase (GGDEF)-like protein